VFSSVAGDESEKGEGEESSGENVDEPYGWQDAEFELGDCNWNYGEGAAGAIYGRSGLGIDGKESSESGPDSQADVGGAYVVSEGMRLRSIESAGLLVSAGHELRTARAQGATGEEPEGQDGEEDFHSSSQGR